MHSATRWILPVLLALTGLAFSSPAELFSRGNAAYEAGDYSQALLLYDSAARRVQNADIYYNRGNARFKLGQVGRAIADYNRAYALAPQDKNVRYNLAFARQYRPDKTLTLENPLTRMVADALRLLDVSTVRVIAAALFLLALASVALLFVFGNRLFGWLGAGLGVLFIYFFLAQLSWGAVVDRNRAVVVVPELTLRSGPGTEYKDMVVVHDGLEVLIRETRPGYVLVQMPGGEGGWAETAAVELIFH